MRPIVRYVLLSLGTGFLLAAARPCLAAPKVAAPKKIEYDGRLLTYNPAWKNEEIYLESNLDDDPDAEIVISFVAMYVTEHEMPEQENKTPFSISQKELLPVYNYMFYQVYDMGADKDYHLARTFTGMDRPGRVTVIPLEEGRPPAMIFVSPGGERYQDVTVYQWREGGYRQLFNRGTSRDVSIVTDTGSPRIILGEDVFAWNQEKQHFEKKETPQTNPSKNEGRKKE
ncbi:MAG: hypothetical protein WC436_06100 [Candidatus Babeliales bacterium]|nr:hypothetical protein [Candidatus Omnitrophota bacterium]